MSTSTEIATWYEVTFKTENGVLTPTHTPIGTGTTLNFAGVEAGEQSIIKCIRIRFSNPIYGLKFWVVNNISGNPNSGGVFDSGWKHGYHIREGKEYTGDNSIYSSSILNANVADDFSPTYYTKDYSNSDFNVYTKLPFGYDENREVELTSSENFNSFVPIPQNSQVFASNPDYHQWGKKNPNGNFGKIDGTSNKPSTEDELQANTDGWVTPYIYLVVTPPISAEGGARTGWGYRISFLYS